jgi:GMP synthase (glutamine-hydrolysing)
MTPYIAEAHNGYGFPPSDLYQVSALFIMGGPMGVYEESKYPFLVCEDAFVKRALDRNIPVMGICLGAQIIAKALGAEVRPSGGFEIGWGDIEITPEGLKDPVFGNIVNPSVVHWHGDAFEIPRGATKLAESIMSLRDGRKIKANQAFRWGRAYAFQFHPEMDLKTADEFLGSSAGDFARGGPNVDVKAAAEAFRRETILRERDYIKQGRDVLLSFLRETGAI